MTTLARVPNKDQFAPAGPITLRFQEKIFVFVIKNSVLAYRIWDKSSLYHTIDTLLLASCYRLIEDVTHDTVTRLSYSVSCQTESDKLIQILSIIIKATICPSVQYSNS